RSVLLNSHLLHVAEFGITEHSFGRLRTAAVGRPLRNRVAAPWRRDRRPIGISGRLNGRSSHHEPATPVRLVMMSRWTALLKYLADSKIVSAAHVNFCHSRPGVRGVT